MDQHRKKREGDDHCEQHAGRGRRTEVDECEQVARGERGQPSRCRHACDDAWPADVPSSKDEALASVQRSTIGDLVGQVSVAREKVNGVADTDNQEEGYKRLGNLVLGPAQPPHETQGPERCDPDGRESGQDYDWLAKQDPYRQGNQHHGDAT